MRTVWATKMEAGRHTNATAPKLNDFFEKTLKPCFEKWGYDKHLIANTDETQLRITATKRPRIIVRRGRGVKYLKDEPEVQHLTLVPTVFANGSHARTLIIYPMRRLPRELTLEILADDEDFVVAGQGGGWITKEIFEAYCLRIIIPAFEEARKKAPPNKQRGLLILDGHSSRWNPKLMRAFQDHGIDVIVLLSHTSHVTQPLDAVVFGTFKHELARSVRRALNEARRLKKTPDGLKPYQDEVAVIDRALQDLEVDPIDDPYEFSAPVEGVLEDPEALNQENGDNSLSLTERRAILVNTAKYAIYVALWKGHVTSSFERTGIFPLSLERCLERDGVRHISSEVQILEDMANAKKRKRPSINGCLLTGEDAIQMLEAEKKAKSGTDQTKRPRGRPPKKKVYDVDTDDE